MTNPRTRHPRPRRPRTTRPPRSRPPRSLSIEMQRELLVVLQETLERENELAVKLNDCHLALNEQRMINESLMSEIKTLQTTGMRTKRHIGPVLSFSKSKVKKYSKRKK